MTVCLKYPNTSYSPVLVLLPCPEAESATGPLRSSTHEGTDASKPRETQDHHNRNKKYLGWNKPFTCKHLCDHKPAHVIFYVILKTKSFAFFVTYRAPCSVTAAGRSASCVRCSAGWSQHGSPWVWGSPPQ